MYTVVIQSYVLVKQNLHSITGEPGFRLVSEGLIEEDPVFVAALVPLLSIAYIKR